MVGELRRVFYNRVSQRHVKLARNLGASRPLCFSVLLISLYLFPLDVHAGFKLCNKSPVLVTSAISTYDNISTFVTGWWNIWPGECTDLLSGPLENRNYYIHAHSAYNLFNWGGDKQICTTNELMNKYRSSSCDDPKKFFVVDIGDKILQDYKQNLICDDCKLPKYKYDKTNNKIYFIDVLTNSEFGQTSKIPIEGEVSLDLTNIKKALVGKIFIRAKLRDVINNFVSQAKSDALRVDECGDNFSITPSISVDGNNARLQASGTLDKWVCTYADLPQITCEDTWIETKGVPDCNTTCEDTWIITDIPFVGTVKTKGAPSCGITCTDTWIKTKGVPQCTNHGFKTVRTSKNRLIQQSGSIDVSLTPTISDGRDVQIEANVTSAKLDGLGQFFADLLGLNLKNMASDAIDNAIDSNDLYFSMPEDVRDFVTLDQVKFDNSNNSINLFISGSFEIKGQDAMKLCAKFWPEGKCQPQ